MRILILILFIETELVNTSSQKLTTVIQKHKNVILEVIVV